jgi:hypothetical protein
MSDSKKRKRDFDSVLGLRKGTYSPESLTAEQKEWVANLIIKENWTYALVTENYGLKKNTVKTWVKKLRYKVLTTYSFIFSPFISFYS